MYHEKLTNFELFIIIGFFADLIFMWGILWTI